MDNILWISQATHHLWCVTKEGSTAVPPPTCSVKDGRGEGTRRRLGMPFPLFISLPLPCCPCQAEEGKGNVISLGMRQKVICFGKGSVLNKWKLSVFSALFAWCFCFLAPPGHPINHRTSPHLPLDVRGFLAAAQRHRDGPRPTSQMSAFQTQMHFNNWEPEKLFQSLDKLFTNFTIKKKRKKK